MKKKITFLLLAISFFIYGSVVISADVRKVDLNLKRNEISFSFLELQTGEATLIQTGKGKNILVNTGGPFTYEELLDRLNMFNIENIDTLILTNLEKEYSANLVSLNKTYDINEIYVSNEISDEFVKKYSLPKEKVFSWKQGDLKELVPNLFVKVLYVGNEKDSEKAEGMVLSLYYGDHQLLFMGSANPEVEMKMIDEQQVKTNILKVGEFAKKGTSQYFLEHLNPQVAIIFHEKERAPSQGVIERLNETWIDIYQTRQFGNITIKFDQENYEVVTIQDEE